MDDELSRELLEQERRRYRMGDDSYQRLHRRRDRKRRNRVIGSTVLALVVAAAGGTGAVLAFRGTGGERQPAAQVTPSVTPSSSPTSSPSPGPTGQAPLFPPQPSSPIQAVGTNEVWYVGLNGEIVHRSGSGEPAIFETGFKVQSIQFIDPQHGWAVAPDQLLRTTDGRVWQQLGQPDPPLRNVQFITPQIGWGIGGATGSAGQLMKTSDGGETWVPVESPLPPESICFAGTTTGWAASGRSIARTEDGGQTWSSASLDLTDNEEPWSSALACGSDSEAWLLLTDGGAAGHLAYVVFHTGDGMTWRPVAQEAGTSPLGQRDDVYGSKDPYPGQITPFGPNGAAFVTWCPACGNSVSLIKTGDDKVSATFDLAAPDEGGEPQGVSFTDPDHGWVLLTVRTDGGTRAALIRIAGTNITVSTG
jgi:photosystem II stability/assembly factor-like uncharacterized protein